MSDGPRYLAIDMGAESARAIVGHFEDGAVRMEELHRWPTRNAETHGVQYWDLLYIFSEIKHALREYGLKYGSELDGIGIDSWGVDFGILGESGQLLQNPVQYRDHRTDGLMEKAASIMGKEAIYAETGIAFLPFNTLYQLWAMQETAPEVLREGKTFLMMSDLLHYFLSGVALCEYTNASTTQLLNVNTRQWSEKIFDAFGLPLDIMPGVADPGTVLGPLDPDIAAEAGLGSPQIITPCTHDTASAVLAVPAQGDNWAYISCGTWSLMGAELAEPVATDAALANNFTNEGGHGGAIRFLKNIMGLWVLQEARAAWARQGQTYEYVDLTEMARSAEAFSTVLDIDDPAFYNPDNMLDAIAGHCRATKQQVPADVGATARAILEGLALRYAITLRQLEETTGRRFENIHMVGGGIRNDLLCQMASDAMDRPVIAGPIEGTALGNIMAQAIATGHVTGREEARRLIADATNLELFEPKDPGPWKSLVERFSQ